MERETFLSGYCRQTDASRTVAVEAEGRTLLEADCCYPDCPHAPNCPIAKKIDEFLSNG